MYVGNFDDKKVIFKHVAPLRICNKIIIHLKMLYRIMLDSHWHCAPLIPCEGELIVLFWQMKRSQGVRPLPLES